MSLESLLNHTCDIYHIQEDDSSPGYNLPASPSFAYPEEPDISGQTCHFGVRSASVTVTQTAPANLMDAKNQTHLAYRYGRAPQRQDCGLRDRAGIHGGAAYQCSGTPPLCLH